MIRKLKSSKAASVTILGMGIVVLCLLCAIFVVDFAKAVYVKNLYNSYAQKAVQTAIKEQDALGGLKPESADKLVQEYMLQREGKSGNTKETKPHSSKCDIIGGYPKIKISYDNKRAKGSSSGVYVSEKGKNMIIPDKRNFFKNQYNTIQVEITDATDNYFFSIFGKPCTEITVKSSGIAVSSQDAHTVGGQRR